ncbi:helix-turn-helix domain-containing protein [Paenibacillus chibensis]|uniref:Helix-turn-helix domain-containing protein n=1 Tax=Paenibacillus chibensis TaxID=59846 RepID=A0ABU6PM28_9BACL|nr:helix-turn-helix domain-containing protein [Paenibacillus chibensis]
MNDNEKLKLEYLKERLADLQKYMNREIEMIMEEVKRLEETSEYHESKEVTEVNKKVVESTSWDHIPDVLSPMDIRKILKIGQSQAYNLVHSKEFHHIKIGNKYLIPKQSFIDWLEGNNKG